MQEQEELELHLKRVTNNMNRMIGEAVKSASFSFGYQIEMICK